MRYNTARIKQVAEHLALLPLVWVGRLVGMVYRNPAPGNMFLVYPNRDTGGSYKVNADLARLFAKHQPLMLFTKKERNGGYRHLFENIPGVTILDISRQIDNKYYHFINVIWRGIIAQWVRQRPGGVLFGGECIFFYKLVPHVHRHARCIELCHVSQWLNYTQAFAPMIHARVFSTQKVMRDHATHYQNHGAPQALQSRLHFIDNKIDIPEPCAMPSHPLKVLFVGRGSPQKRVYLVAAIARRLKQLRPHIQFTLVGDIDAFVDDELRSLVTVRTDVNQAAQLRQLYQEHHVLLLTSLFEGLPLVVMDMMAQGRVVVSTAVDGIPDYILDEQTGLLIQAVKDEDAVVSEGIAALERLDDDEALTHQLGEAARRFALAHFSSTAFDAAYTEIFFPPKA